jgi:hypothetical protein
LELLHWAQQHGLTAESRISVSRMYWNINGMHTLR